MDEQQLGNNSDLGRMTQPAYLYMSSFLRAEAKIFKVVSKRESEVGSQSRLHSVILTDSDRTTCKGVKREHMGGEWGSDGSLGQSRGQPGTLCRLVCSICTSFEE